VGGGSESSEIESMLATAFKLHNQKFQQAIVIGLSAGERSSGREIGSWKGLVSAEQRHELASLAARAVRVVKDPAAPPAEIKSALALLPVAGHESGESAVLELLDRFPPGALQVSAIRTLSEMNAPGLETNLISRWKVVAPEARREILSALTAKRKRFEALLSALDEARILPGEIDPVTRAALLQNSDPVVRQRAAIFWSPEKAGTRADVI